MAILINSIPALKGKETLEFQRVHIKEILNANI